jgi:tetratricopeptide (TPR) repeat protein
MARQGKHGAAKRLFTSLTEVRPQSEKAWAWLAQALEARGRFADAVNAYRTIIRINPDSATANNRLGHLLFKLRRFDEAVMAFERAVELKPDYLEADVNRANTLFMLGQLPTDKLAHYSAMNAALGDKASKNGASAFAAYCYRQAIAMKSDLVGAHYGLGQVLHAQGEADNARQSFQRAAEIDPGYLDVIDRLGSIVQQPARQAQQPAHTARP